MLGTISTLFPIYVRQDYICTTPKGTIDYCASPNGPHVHLPQHILTSYMKMKIQTQLFYFISRKLLWKKTSPTWTARFLVHTARHLQSSRLVSKFLFFFFLSSNFWRFFVLNIHNKLRILIKYRDYTKQKKFWIHITMTTMESLIGLVNRIQMACTALGDYGGDDEAFSSLWDALPSVAVVGGQVRISINHLL